MAESASETKQLIPIQVTSMGLRMSLTLPPYETLIELVRDRLGLSGTKKSCDMQVCGACTVLLDGRPVSACTVLAFEARDTELTTIEGMADGEQLASHPRSVYCLQWISVWVLYPRDDFDDTSVTGRKSVPD